MTGGPARRRDVESSLPAPVRAAAFAVHGAVQARRRFGSDFARESSVLEERQKWSPARIREWQGAARSDILRAAWASPYYRSAFDELGLQPTGLGPQGELTDLPLLTREVLQARADEMLVRGANDYVWHQSSGTTGSPVRFALPRALRWGVNAAHLYLFYAWHGFFRGDRRVTLGGRYVGLAPNGIVLWNPFEQQLLLSAHSLNEDSAVRYVRAMAKFHPKALQGHPSALTLLVRHALARDLALPSVPLVFTTGEVLIDEDRLLLADSFDARVVAQYGHGEMTVMANECEAQQGYHVDPYWGLVELLPAPAGLYEIVTTSLLNTVMPLIRYRTGDLTSGWVDEPCSCGRVWPRLKDVIGRTDELVLDARSAPVAPVALRTALAHRFDDLPVWSLTAMPEPGRYRLQLFPEHEPPPHLVTGIVDELRRHLGDDAHFELSVGRLRDLDGIEKWRTVRSAGIATQTHDRSGRSRPGESDR
jgi:phenylacetate-CoA ligase